MANEPSVHELLRSAITEITGLTEHFQQEKERAARVRKLHKPEMRYSPMEDLEFSFDTYDEASDYTGGGEVHTFEVCEHCGEIEMRQATDFGDYLEALWPCPTIRALDGEAPDA